MTFLLWNLWARFEKWVIIAGAILAGIGTVFLAGRQAGKRVMKERLAKAEARHLRRLTKVKERQAKIATQGMSDEELEKDLDNGSF